MSFYKPSNVLLSLIMFKNSSLSQESLSAFWRVNLFLLFSGLITKVNGIFSSIHHQWFDLNHFQSMLVPKCFFLASLVIAPVIGGSLQYVGYRKGMLLALLTAIVSGVLITYAHLNQLFLLFLAAIFLLGMAVKSLLVAGAAYAMVAGPADGESGRVSLVQGFYSIGALSAPLIGFALLHLHFSEQRLVWLTYSGFAIVMALIAFSVYRLPQFPQREIERPKGFFPKMSRPLVLGFLAMFMYMGFEVCLDSLMIKYLTDPLGGGIPLKYSMGLMSFYFLGFAVGRFIGSSLLNRVSLPRILIINTSISLLLLLIGISWHHPLATASLLAIGFSNSILYPAILAIAVKEDNQSHSKVTGFITTAAIGGALFPLVQGLLADRYDLRSSFYFLIIPCFALISYGIFLRKKQRQISMVKSSCQ